jgi:RNA polymerase sigma factor (sigma-70 family)
VLRHDGPEPTDGQLLDDFLGRHDEAALAALVWRHGPMVWGVCRRQLSHHDAEDAFQATFLVLVRKAASIRPRKMVANWLHGVAHQTALNARAAAARRRERERQVTEMPEPAAIGHDSWRHVQPLLDDELSRLPDRYRAVIVLCDLEGKTRKDAARQLGVPEGTVAGWVARARVLLAKRLAKRGVALSGGALAAVLAERAVPADVPAMVVSSMIEAAATGAISARAATLSDGVTKSMLLRKLRSAVAVALALGMACAGASLCLHGPARGEQEPARDERADQASADVAGRFNHRVPFETGLTETNEGGRIEILEVWGTRPRIEVGGYYLVRGKYVLPPGRRGALYLFATAGGAWGRVGTIMDHQHTVVDKEMGEFTLMHGMAGPGYFHVYLADPDRYSRMFANVYFGTGDTVWRAKH